MLVDHNRERKGMLKIGEHKSIQTDRVILVAGPAEEVAVVRWIYRAFHEEGKQEAEIAAALNARGVLTDWGRPWTRAPGGLFAAGTQQVAVLQFAIRPGAANPATITFNDTPVMREVSDAAANVLSTSYVDGLVAIPPLPVLQISQQGTNVVLSWPVSSGAFLLQSADTPGSGSWNPVPLAVVTNGPAATVTVPATNTQAYYRLQGN